MHLPRFTFVQLLGHHIHITEWGDPKSPAIILWHGLARTSRDFDELAAALADHFFVLCPDTIGRGLSSWSANPHTEYTIEHYTKIAIALLDNYGIDKAGWLGTSMGGLVGIHLAAGTGAKRLRWLILNDVAPQVPQAAIDRILKYAQTRVRFTNLLEAEQWFRAVYASFGEASDAFWQRITLSSVRRTDGGDFTTHYDPRITLPIAIATKEADTSQIDRIWEGFAGIGLPVHLLRGKQSDVVPHEYAEKMQCLLPEMGLTTFEDCGHAPSLSQPEDHQTVSGIIQSFTS